MTLKGVELSHWDLWLIVVIRDLSGGKRELVEALKARARRYSCSEKHDIEAKLSHLLDLETRLLAAGLTHGDVLAEVVVDYSLLRKARSKILDHYVSHKTRAMIETPRKILSERARRGYWIDFPINPKEYEGYFVRFCQAGGYYDYRGTSIVVDLLTSTWERERLGASSVAAKAAVDRAAMTVIVEMMDHVDDSGGDMGRIFEPVLASYVATVWEAAISPEIVLRDAIEFGIWEHYGLSDNIAPFIRAVPREHGHLAVRIFAETTAELFINGLEYEHTKALSMWSELVVAHERFDELEYVAHRLGAEAWGPIVTMASVAWSFGRKEVTRAVFAAANRQGPQRDRLRKACLQLTGEEPPACRPHLRLILAARACRNQLP
jgi:hypothetical protein